MRNYTPAQLGVGIRNAETVLNWYATRRTEGENTKGEQRIINLNFAREQRFRRMLSSSKQFTPKYL